jgi:Flp pilus assembly protein TadB
LEPAFRGTPVVELPGSLAPVIRIEGTQLVEKFMKPTPQIQQRSPRKQENFPLTDYSYQTTAEAVENSSTLVQKQIRTRQLSASWKISRDYFGAEATRDFVAEFIFFAWIAVVAAWAISVMLHQLLRWMI